MLFRSPDLDTGENTQVALDRENYSSNQFAMLPVQHFSGIGPSIYRSE